MSLALLGVGVATRRSRLGRVAAITATRTKEAFPGTLSGELALLHMSSSQKQSWPFRLDWLMHTWSTMNRFIRSSDVQVRLIFGDAGTRESKGNGNGTAAGGCDVIKNELVSK